MSEISRRTFLKKAGATLPLAAAAMTMRDAASQPAAKPNIVYILVDDLGYGDLSCYGAEDMQTPNIDALMDSGMRFNQFYANCPVCSPTRAALLTGCYPDCVGVPGVIRTHADNTFGYLDPEAPLLPAMLKQAGYNTAIVGKWHLGLEAPNLPNLRGFDYFHGFLGDMMDDYYTHLRHDVNYMRENETEIHPEGHATDLFTEWAVSYVHDQKEKPEPFFLYLAYNAPHTPIQPPREWVSKVKQREPEITPKRAALVALIEHLDAGIGKVVQALKETGAYENTLLVFVSDNGGQTNVAASNGSLRGSKAEMYEGGIRVPMCAVWPGHITPGQRNDACTALSMDLFATACASAEVPVAHEIDGVDLSPVFKGDADTLPERTLFWVRREGGNCHGMAHYAVRRGDWKLCQGGGPASAFELFNLAEDPLEQKSLPEKHPMYRELSQALKMHIIRSGRAPWQPPTS